MDEQLLPDEKTEKRNSNFKRREQKTYYVNDSKRVDNDFNKIIIPFQFELNKYDINESEVSFYDNKEYLFNTINYFNSLDSFKIDSNYHPTCLQKLSLFIPSMIVFIILLYISFIFLLKLKAWSFLALIKIHHTIQFLLSGEIHNAY